MSEISKNITDGSKYSSEVIINACVNFKASAEAKSAFRRKPYYMTGEVISNENNNIRNNN